MLDTLCSRLVKLKNARHPIYSSAPDAKAQSISQMDIDTVFELLSRTPPNIFADYIMKVLFLGCLPSNDFVSDRILIDSV